MVNDIKFENEKRSPFIVRLFRGDVPLVITFWVYGILINFLLNLVAFIYPLMSSNPSLFFIQVFSVIGILYLIFIWVAIVRSALKYHGPKIWRILAIIVVILGIINLVYTFTIGFKESKMIISEWSDLNKTLPRMIDTDMRLESVTFEGNALFYHITLVNQTVNEVDVPKFEAIQSEKFKENACKDSDTKKFLDDDLDLIYIIRDKDDNKVTKLLVTPSDCS